MNLEQKKFILDEADEGQTNDLKNKVLKALEWYKIGTTGQIQQKQLLAKYPKISYTQLGLALEKLAGKSTIEKEDEVYVQILLAACILAENIPYFSKDDDGLTRVLKLHKAHVEEEAIIKASGTGILPKLTWGDDTHNYLTSDAGSDKPDLISVDAPRDGLKFNFNSSKNTTLSTLLGSVTFEVKDAGTGGTISKLTSGSTPAKHLHGADYVIICSISGTDLKLAVQMLNQGMLLGGTQEQLVAKYAESKTSQEEVTQEEAEEVVENQTENTEESNKETPQDLLKNVFSKTFTISGIPATYEKANFSGIILDEDNRLTKLCNKYLPKTEQKTESNNEIN